MVNLGEHSRGIRAATTGRLHHLGLDLDLDTEANASAEADADVATSSRRARVLVVTAREDLGESWPR